MFAVQGAVAVIENMVPKIIVFFCPACRNRWSAEEPGAPGRGQMKSNQNHPIEEGSEE